MIQDKIIYLKEYFSEKQYEKIEKFLSILDVDMEEKKYEIDGDNIFAKVMSYQTSASEQCKIEAHNEYIDIQATLVGCEGIDIYERNKLSVLETYSSQNDIEFFQSTEEPYISVSNNVGYFSLIFPEEAHKPQISVDGKCSVIKKFVIKVKKELMRK